MSRINKKTLAPLDLFLIFGVVTCTVIYSITTSSFDIIGAIVSLTGVVCVVLCAKGNILNYPVGIVNVCLYAWVSFKSQLYGDAILNACYYLPMNCLGWINWSKQMNENDSTKVKAGVLNTRNRLIALAVCVFAVSAVALILQHFNDAQPWTDSAKAVLCVIAMFLMVKAYKEHWVLWLVTNVLGTVMWAIQTINGEPHAEMMLIMFIFYTINSVNGIVQWNKYVVEKNV